MPRAKKDTIDLTDQQDQQVNFTAPRRSTRKRAQVNYTPPADEDPDWRELPSKKAKVTESYKPDKAEVVMVKDDDDDNADIEEAHQGVTTSRKQAKKAMEADVVETVGSVIPPAQAAPRDQVPAQILSKPKPKPKPRRGRVAEHVVEYNDTGEEVRKREFQAVPHANFAAKKERALSQPIRFLARQRLGEENGYPQEQFTIMGSVGSSYAITIKLVPHCTCRDFTFRKASCKHIIYTLHYVLKVPSDSQLLYQNALTSSELHAMFEAAAVSAPPIDGHHIESHSNRKPIEGDCPICYMDFVPEQDLIVYCKAKCGQNVHKQCISDWIDAQQRSYRKSTCPYCREQWVT